MSDFVHLHNHTHYSILDAVSTPAELVAAAVADGQPAVALTDHGVMYGLVDFYNAAKEQGIKPIIGMEAYLANGSRFDKSAGKSETKKKNYYHIILLVKNDIGYRNLCKLSSLAHTEGFYYRPRIDKELLEKYSEGLICTTACIGGSVNSLIAAGQFDLAMNEARYFRDIFGDDFYLELQNHNIEGDREILRDAPRIAKALGNKIIATNDIHYIKKEHAIAHNVLLHIRDASGTNGNLPDIYKLRYKVPEFYFKTYYQMQELFKEFPESLSNTMEIAEKCNWKLNSTLAMPIFPIPISSKAANLDEYLEEIVWQGIYKRYPNYDDKIKDRTAFELKVIKDMGFSGYFLIVWDFIDAARNLGVRVGPGRGSAAGSIVAYALGITNIDPLPYNLLFERFLNPERVSMPDIDIDFHDEKRDKVIDYVKQKYGENAVAQIVTFGKLSSKAVLTDVGRVLGIELSKIKEITKAIPTIRGKVLEIAKAVELPELRWIKESEDSRIKDLIEFSKLLENRIRQTGIHAAGVVIAPGNITDYVPVYKSNDKDNGSIDIATQFAMSELEKAGLLKMDFLGLKTLSIIDNTLEMIEKNHNLKIEIEDIDFNDKKVYDLISNGDTLAIFQFESQGMQEYLKRLKPNNLEEITAMNALYRPGPMDNIPDFIDRKFGRKKIEYLHPLMESVLDKTYGIIVYQEQVMQLVQVIGNFSLGQADMMRRAMGKKKPEIMMKLKSEFSDGAKQNGLDDKTSGEIFDLIVKFAEYGFNKSHSVAYSYLAYQTAWLKTHYTAEYLAANMSAEIEDQDQIVELRDEAKKFGIELLAPDINSSKAKFTVKGNKIYFGLAGIKNVGISVVDSLEIAREKGHFKTFFDFVVRVDLNINKNNFKEVKSHDIKTVNRRTLEALICSGAFDSICNNKRKALFDSIDTALAYAKAYNESNSSSMDSLFGGDVQAQIVEPTLPNVTDWDDKERLAKEKEFLNFYVSGHPLNQYEAHVKSLSTFKLSDWESLQEGKAVIVCGMIKDIRKRRDKRDRQIAFIMLEDFWSKAECIFWSDTYTNYEKYLENENIIVITGKAEAADEVVKITVDKVFSIEEAVAELAKSYVLTIDLDKTTVESMNEVHKLITNNTSSNGRVYFHIKNQDASYRKKYIAYNLPVKINNEVFTKLISILGIANVRLGY